MPVVIGAKPESGFDNPLGLLTDCHRRVEKFLDVLVRVGETSGGALMPEVRTALETALRYFRESAPKHTADEEESLFPRLRMLDRPEFKGVLDQVAGLERDHAEAAKSHAELDRLGETWLAGGTLSSSDLDRFRTVALRLADLYREHIRIEERDVFPAAAALGRAECESIGAEMAARRGLAARQ